MRKDFAPIVDRTDSSRKHFMPRRKRSSNNATASNSLLRGRAALEQAENHIKIFEEYLRKNAPLDASCTNFVTDKVMVEKTAENFGFRVSSKEESHEKFLSNFDEIVEDFQLPDTEIYRKSKRKGNFDPQELSVAKRAVVKASILAENHALEEAKLKKKSQFKARPLPNGNHIKNDPYALTKAAQAKLTQGSVPEEKNRRNRVDASTILGQNNHVADFNMNSPKKPHYDTARKKNFSRDFVYNKITDMIENDEGMELDEIKNMDEIDGPDKSEKDLAYLHKQISKLQAELTLKRMKCIQAIEEIEIQGEDKVDVTTDYECINSPPRQKALNDHCFHYKEIVQSSRLDKYESKANEIKKVKSNTSLYDRHNKWLKMREERRKDAKEKEDLELVKDVTGKPNLNGAQESWIKAKLQHDGLMKSLKLKDESLKAEKEVKDRAIKAKQFEEIERLKALASKKSKLTKSGIDGKKQSEYIDKLSRPMSSRRKDKVVSKKISITGDVKPEKSASEGNCDDQASKCDNNDKEVSFADMNDKDFSKMIKKLQAKASEGKRTVFRVTGDVQQSSRPHIPYQRYECGEIPFFDRSSSMEKGRFRVRDAREYHADSLRRVPVSFRGISSCDGVMFLVGKRVDGDSNEEEVVTVLFLRSQFSEDEAAEWWNEHKNKIIVP